MHPRKDGKKDDGTFCNIRTTIPSLCCCNQDSRAPPCTITTKLLLRNLSNDNGDRNKKKKHHLKITRKIMFNLCYFTIISTHSTCTKTANYPRRNQIGRHVFELRMGITISPSYTHVLHKTLNLVISHPCFPEDGKEMYQNLKCTCRATVFAHLTYFFTALSFPSPLS